jgi:glycosyltransferase involved in cell wall biosynthesis
MPTGLDDLGRYGVLCFGGEDWWYHNRGHCDMQFMRQFARLGPVLYVNSIMMRKPNLGEGRMFLRRLARKVRSMARGLIRVPEGFQVYSPVTAPVHHVRWFRALNDRLLRGQIRRAMRRAGLTTPLVWVNCPAACDTALALSRWAMVYQRTDRYEEYPGVDARQIELYDRKLKATADLVFFSNRRLYEEEKDQCRKAAYVDHGVAYELFAAAERNPWIPPEMRSVRRPVAGFYGGIDRHTVDLRLLEHIVAALPDVTFVFIGKASVDCTPLLRRPNVVMIDQRPYEQIPHYGKCFDVCLMPWNQNRWIEACNPIKLKEYLALGKPVVSTPFPQLAEYEDLVLTARTPEDFSACIRRVLAAGHEVPRSRMRDVARRSSWHRQALHIVSLLNN